MRLSHTGEAASLADRLFLPDVTASLPAYQHPFTSTPMTHVRVGVYSVCTAQSAVVCHAGADTYHISNKSVDGHDRMLQL